MEGVVNSTFCWSKKVNLNLKYPKNPKDEINRLF